MITILELVKNASPIEMADFLQEINNGQCDSCPAFQFCKTCLNKDVWGWSPQICKDAFRDWINSKTDTSSITLLKF